MNTRWLVFAMMVTLALFVSLAYWDEARESEDGLEQFGDEQARLAWMGATTLSEHLHDLQQDAQVIADDDQNGGSTSPLRLHERYSSIKVRRPDEPDPRPTVAGNQYRVSVPISDGRIVDLVVPSSVLLSGLGPLEQPGATLVLILPPNVSSLQTADGRELRQARLVGALEGGTSVVRLKQAESAELGLPARTAMVGLGRVNAGALGRWGVAVVASAVRMRDRDRRAQRRLVLAMLLGSCIVLGFGGLALRNQRAEMQLARELAVAEVVRERDTKLERLSKAATMVTLASGVAHELSTPLGVIVGRAEQVLLRAEGDERLSRAAQTILEQANHIHRVVRGFLSLARGVAPAMVTVPPNVVVQEAVALVAHRFSQAEVNLVNAVPADLPRVRCEPKLLQHALVNLLINACDASPKGSSARIEARADAAEVAFIVTDEGVGITPANAARATEPFFTTKSEEKGTGLGLAIANEIAKTHRGSLSIAPREPRGTRASIEIPIEEVPHADAG